MFFLIKRQGAVLFKMKYLKSETETEKKASHVFVSDLCFLSCNKKF